MATYNLAPADVESFVLTHPEVYVSTPTITYERKPSKITWSAVPSRSFDYFSPGGGDPDIAVRATYIDSDSTADTVWTGNVPTHFEGDLLVAVIMTRTNGGVITPPTDWTQQGSAYLSNLQFSGGSQDLKVFTKLATASEPATATWTQAISSRICGFLVSMVGNNFTMGVATQAYGNGEDASITNAGADFYITAATWLYSSATTPETYSQTGLGLTQITDSPNDFARISGGYTSEDGLVASFHSDSSGANDPNHGIISIPFIFSGGGGGGGGGSIRPTSGFLYPRGDG